MKTSSLKWVIGLMGVSLIGLVAFQLYWIDSVVKANEERFTQDVMEAMNSVALKLEKQETVAALNKFQTLNSLQPTFKPRNPQTRMASFDQQPPRERQALEQTSAGSNTFFGNPNSTQNIVVADTLQADGFQVVFNYEFTNVPAYGYSPFGFSETVNPNDELEMELEEKQFQIDRLEDQVRWYSRKYEMVSSVMDDLLSPGRKLAHRFNPEQLDSLLKNELLDKGIHLPYDYGVIAPRMNRFVVLDKPEKQESLESSDLRASLFPNDIMGSRAMLVIDFPGKSGYLLEKIWLTMVTSGVLVLVIVLIFGYSIRTILRQKKLSLMKNDFINNMTHEFKTPIATVSLATEALQDSDVSKSPAMYSRYIKMIQDENVRLGSQVERVLQIAAIEKQDFNLVKEELDIHAMIQSIVENMKIQAESKGGRITTVLNAAICEINGDETHISNCIMNLLDNANKYSTDSPNIIVRTESTANSLLITVQDHGMGMSKEAQRQVFEKFYRVPTGNRHDVKGFGLGLSYVRNMVEAHDGSVEVDSTLGKGSKFTITLPLN